MEKLKSALRPAKRIISLLYIFSYDAYRYLLYSSLLGRRRGKVYKITKIYHRLEKSLSFRNRNRKAAQGAAFELIALYDADDSSTYTYQHVVGLNVLDKYSENSDLTNDLRGKIDELVETRPISSTCGDSAGGALRDFNDCLRQGVLDNPETFFLSRYSVRNFSEDKVLQTTIERALNLASKTPSVCNRQGWAIYQLTEKTLISSALKFQNGNRGFGQDIGCLFVIASDLSAFEGETERFQNWIDGGLYAMSLVYAFHSLGVASCILNLCNSPATDMKLRKLLGAPKAHSFVVMLAVGYPCEHVSVCASARTPPEQYLFKV